MGRLAVLRCGVRCICAVLMVLSAPSWSSAASPAAPPDCKSQDNAQTGFSPRAYTLTSMYVRTKAPEYSLLKGQWILGDPQGILPPGTCLHIIKREVVGVIQVWYWVHYLDARRQVRTGWVWAGTKDKDEGTYIGGDTTPRASSRRIPSEPSRPDPLAWFASEAYAQADTLPPVAGTEDTVETMLPRPPVVEMDYLVELPVLRIRLSLSTVSALVLFAVMVAGMLAKAVWDQIEKDGRLQPSTGRLVRPLLVAPIAFSAFWGPMYVQQGGGGLSLTMALYAFQIGFMWQHVLEKKTGGA